MKAAAAASQRPGDGRIGPAIVWHIESIAALARAAGGRPPARRHRRAASADRPATDACTIDASSAARMISSLKPHQMARRGLAGLVGHPGHRDGSAGRPARPVSVAATEPTARQSYWKT